MTEASNRDTWSTRDYPVLVAAAQHLDAHPGRAFQPLDITLAGALGLSVGEATAAVIALMPDYLVGKVEHMMVGDPHVMVSGVTSEGRREAGLWPKRDDQLASLIAAIEATAEQTEDDEQRTTLRRVGDGLASVPGNVLSGIATAWLASQGIA
ncbi:MAG: hypothetical protein WA892_06750 [Ornithinimicrobium sp.]